MTCPVCGAANPADNKFCGTCGNALSRDCPSCGTNNPPDHKFCGECGTALGTHELTDRSTPTRAERRIVSVLFADLVGFTSFSENRDPEEVRSVITGYFDRSREIVERFAGTVDKFIGDAVMAWWGAVETQEDDAERAVRAALELVDMVEELGTEIGVPELALRAGVLTGETSVGPGGNEKGLVLGDMVNTASRLQSRAAPGTVVVGDSTRNLVAGAVEFEPLGGQQLEGKALPVAAFRALRVVAERGGRGRTEGIEPPFVGRQEELRLLKDQLHATGRDGRARLVSLVGEAGIGKSRLAWELLKYIDGIAEPIYWHSGRSPSYGDGVAFWSLGEMVRRRARIAETDDQAESRRKLRDTVAEYLPSEEEGRTLEPRLAGLLGLDEMPPGDRNDLFAAIRIFFQRISEHGTTVLVFEDLHWADDGMLEFITDLVERSTKHPILIVTLARPDLLERHSGWGAGRRNHLSVHLAPLPDPDMHSLVTGMAPGLPDAAVEAITGRAGGIPLYAVEFVRMLLGGGELRRTETGFDVEADLSDLAVPDSLAAVIGARLDRLDPDLKVLVQDAAVLGHSFTARGLAAVREIPEADLEAPLADLVHHELFELDDDPRSPERGQYRLVQSLIEEVAYSRLSKEDRHIRHLRAAEYFASLDEPELAGVVASHYAAAHRTAPADAEDMLERGRSALVEAAQRMASLQSHRQAVSLYREALELADDPGQRGDLLVAATDAAMWAGMDDAEELGRAALKIMEQAGNRPGELRAAAALASSFSARFRADEAAALLRPYYETLDRIDDEATAGLGLEMVRSLMLNQQHEEAIVTAERVLPPAEQIAPIDAVINGIISKATALGAVGRVQESLATLRGAVAVSDEHGIPSTAIRALNNLVVVQSTESPRAAAEAGEELYERVMAYGAGAWMSRANGDRALLLIAFGRFDEALEMLELAGGGGLPEIVQALTHGARHFVEAVTGADPDAPRKIIDMMEGWTEVGDPQARTAVVDALSAAHELDGALGESFEAVQGVPWPQSAARALRCALLLRDPERAGSAIEGVRHLLPRGRLRAALIAIGEAGLAALGGESGAPTRYEAALELLGEVALPMEQAHFQALCGALFGLDDPAARAMAATARDWVVEVGAHGLLARWARWLPPVDEGRVPAD